MNRNLRLQNRLLSVMSCIFAVLLSIQLAGCSSPAQKEAVSAPEKTVAVSKSIADLWLLSGGSLVGTTEDAMELDGISDGTAVIGTLSHPEIEAVLALNPDLVLLTEDIHGVIKFSDSFTLPMILLTVLSLAVDFILFRYRGRKPAVTHEY